MICMFSMCIYIYTYTRTTIKMKIWVSYGKAIYWDVADSGYKSLGKAVL